MSNLFTPFKLRGVVFPNRLGIPPMCMVLYLFLWLVWSKGRSSKWFSSHTLWYWVYIFNAIGSYALEGFGFIIQEATAICKKGRISYKYIYYLI